MRDYQHNPDAFRQAVIDFFSDEYIRGERGIKCDDDVELWFSVKTPDVNTFLRMTANILNDYFKTAGEVETDETIL